MTGLHLAFQRDTASYTSCFWKHKMASSCPQTRCKLGVWNVGSRILILRTVWGRSNPWQQPDIDCVENMNPVELSKLMDHNDWNHKYLRVPVFLRDPVQAPKHNWKDLVNVLFDEAENVLIIPEVERSFCYLPEQMTQRCWCKRFFSPARLIKETLNSAWVTVKYICIYIFIHKWVIIYESAWR